VSRRTFAIGIVVLLAVFALIGLGIDRLNGDRLRPEGVAEDWLVAVGDTTRKGVRAESEERAAELGPVELAKPLLDQAGDTDGKRAFADLEVGKATVAGPRTRVPFQLHVYDQDKPHDGVVVLTRIRQIGAEAPGGWRVVGLDQRRPGEEVPSEGGPPPSSAPNWVWAAGLAGGVLLTALCALAVRLASPRS
jgi:hypothetical protein